MKLSAIFVLLLAASAHAMCPRYVTTTFSDKAADTSELSGIVSDFQDSLGGSNNGNSLGPINSGGFRQINWDAAVVPFDMPGNFFNKDVPRGAILKAKGGKFAVSNPSPNPTNDDKFSSILPTFVTSKFRTFSPFRLFTPVKRNKFSIQFRVPGSSKKAAVTGFGAVFTDVRKKRKTTMQFYDKRGCLIAKVAVPPSPSGLSFVGVIVQTPGNVSKALRSIYRVNIKLGNISVEKFAKGYPAKKGGDVVVMDDFIYGEPL